MAGKKSWRMKVSTKSSVPAIRLRQLYPVLHKYLSLVSASFSYLGYSDLMGNQAAPEYLFDISHPASSSTEASACSVEPGSAEDVSKIVRLTRSDVPASVDPHF